MNSPNQDQEQQEELDNSEEPEASPALEESAEPDQVKEATQEEAEPDTQESEEAVVEEKAELPEFGPGDTVKVHLRVKEGDRERMQVFEGVVISKRGPKQDRTFTVRKISFGVGVEKIFPANSPVIAKLEVVARGDVRRAKLYYLRDRVGKASKIKEKREI